MEKRAMKRALRIFTVAIALIMAAVIVTPSPSQAQTNRYWIGGNYEYGYQMWYIPENWQDDYGNPGIPNPDNNDNAYVGTFDTPWAQVAYNHWYSSGNLNYLRIDNDSTLFYVGFGYLPVLNTDVGYVSTGTFQLGWGLHNVQDSLVLGVNVGSTGIYEISSGALNVGLNTIVGNSGTGTFNQSDGTATVNGNLYLGNNWGSEGTYNLSGDSSVLWVGGYELIGLGGTGIFTQTGGTHTIDGGLTLGQGLESSGTYNLSGTGSLSITNDMYIGVEGTGSFIQNGSSTVEARNIFLGTDGGSGSYELLGGNLSLTGVGFIGYNGTGIFTQSGGTHRVLNGGTLEVGGAGNGTYNLITGDLIVTGSTIVGNWGTGTFNQGYNPDTDESGDGGTHTVNDNLIIGNISGSSGTYNLYAGQLAVGGSTIVGNEGTGAFNLGIEDPDNPGTYLGDGTHNTAALYIGFNGGSGTYNLYSGTLDVGGFTVIGGKDYTLNPGIGEFNQYGGTHDTGGLWLGDSVDSTGTYNLYGGDLTVWSYDVIGMRGTGVFNQWGGTHTANTALSLGGWMGTSDGIYNLYGGDLITNGTVVGDWGKGTFYQDGGTHTVNGDLILAANPGTTGTYNLNGGTLTADFIQVANYGKGTFTQTGGTVTVTTVLPGDLNLGQSLGSEGLYDLSGASSQLTVGRNLNVGLDGRGTFNQDKGSVNVGEGLIIAGATTANGSSYTLKAGEVSSDWLYIGFNGTGTFTQDGGTNTTGALYLALNPGSSGTYTQKGGTNTVNGGLNVASGSSSNGTYNLNDGSLTTTGYVWVGYWGTGVFNQTGGIFDVTNPSDGISIASQIGSTGEFNLSGGDLKVTGIESVGTRGTGTFTQIGSSTNTVDGNLVLGNLYAGAVGTYNLSGTGKLKSGGTIVGNLGTGTFNQYGGTHEVSNNLTIGSTGTYNKYGGTLNVSGNINNNGTFNFTGGDVITSLLQNYGLFKGSGASFTGSVINYGTVNPGLSPGTLNITGNYTQDPLGILLIELAGYEKGTEYDFLNITGTATLGGTLKIDLLDIDLLGTFNPVIGSIFNILYADQGRSGTFAFLDLPAFGDGRGWEIDYGSNDVTVRVTPIPSTLLLLGSGLIGFVGLMRRKLKR